MNRLPIVLASGSAIRREVLSSAGVPFEVITKAVDEAAIKASMIAEGSRLRDIADALAEAKSIRVSKTTSGLVIGADQIMVMDGQLFDKPKDIEEARARLWSMRGKTHKLMGALVICEGGAPVWRHLSVVSLKVREFSESFLDDYIEAEGESLLYSVGAYKFEGRGAQIFEQVEGDMFSILGLSLLPLLEYLRLRGAIET